MKKGKSKKVDFMQIALVIGGGLAAAKVASIALPVIPEKARPALPFVLGLVLMHNKNASMKSLGLGMVAVGGFKTVASFIPQLGISGEAMSDYMIEGPGGDFALAGPESDPVGAMRNYSLAGTTDDGLNTDMAG